MDLEARPLQYFTTVARESSFSRAAQKLNVSQPSLSAQVRELERRLGFPLFTRTSRHVELTREGRLFLPQALQMIAEAARMNRTAREIRENELRIGAAIYSVLIPERTALIEAFMEQHPDIAVAIVNPTQSRLFAEIKRGDLDLGVVLVMAKASVGELDASASASEIVLPVEFDRLDLLEKRVELLVPRECPLAEMGEIPLDALAGVSIAMLGDYHGAPLIDAIAEPLDAAGADLVVPPEGNAIAVERFGCKKRMPAISIGWFRAAEAPQPSDMVRVPFAGLDVGIALAVVRSAHAPLRPAAEAFWSFAARAVGDGADAHARDVGVSALP